jgi:hypothetical protein
LNYDPKWHLRLTLTAGPLRRHSTTLLNPLFKLAIKYLEPTRHDPILQRFPDAQRLYPNFGTVCDYIHAQRQRAGFGVASPRPQRRIVTRVPILLAVELPRLQYDKRAAV